MSFWRVRGDVVHQSSEPWTCELLPTYVGCPKMGLAVCMLIRMPMFFQSFGVVYKSNAACDRVIASLSPARGVVLLCID
jgi:hypothetical protein